MKPDSMTPDLSPLARADSRAGRIDRGSRYAVVADPDGNDVGLMSPIDEQHRSWPPSTSPDL